MTVADFILVAVSLSMDAVAVSLCEGLAMRKIQWRGVLLIAFSFGFFQFLMPLVGWFLGVRAEKFISPLDHWVASGLLALIGGKMIRDAFHPERGKEAREAPPAGELLILSVATSIDALAVGLSFAFLSVPILEASLIIGLVTFALSFLAVLLGHRVGVRFQAGSQASGGVILILISLKILLESFPLP